jgi:hypothetical protein
VGELVGARAVAATLCALALACSRGEGPPGSGQGAGSAPPPAPGGASTTRAPEPGRGDRHARAAARQAPRLREITGVVVRADERRLAIRPRSGPVLTLRLGPSTALRAGGRRSGPETLHPGLEVRASYRSDEGGPATAVSVDVAAPPPPVDVPAPPAPPPARPAPPEAEPYGSDHG